MISATLQTNAIFILIIVWILEGRRPTLINIVGCMLLFEGVTGFQYIRSLSDTDNQANNISISDLVSAAFVWCLISAFSYAVLNHIQDTSTSLAKYNTALILGMVGCANFAWEWIPVLIAHAIGKQR